MTLQHTVFLYNITIPILSTVYGQRHLFLLLLIDCLPRHSILDTFEPAKHNPCHRQWPKIPTKEECWRILASATTFQPAALQLEPLAT
nr:hypothetical protein L204_06167 [Cryptococcus depauperatus CBS 7855]